MNSSKCLVLAGVLALAPGVAAAAEPAVFRGPGDPPVFGAPGDPPVFRGPGDPPALLARAPVIEEFGGCISPATSA